MASIDLRVPHSLSTEEAVKRVQGMLTTLKQEQAGRIQNLKESWTDSKGHFQFSVQGFDTEGTIHVENNQVHVAGTLPFALSLFKGTISQMIEKNLTDLLKN